MPTRQRTRDAGRTATVAELLDEPFQPATERQRVELHRDPGDTHRPPNLAPDHFQKLRGSGLSLGTIAAAGVYTEYDTPRLRLMLRGSSAVAPALILPGFDQHGKRTGYNVARLIPPHHRHDGSEAKYLMPTGLGNRAYFPPHPCVLEAVHTPGARLLVTEGILKALAASQSGVPCVGLMGVWNWVVRRSDPRELIPDMAGINWRNRHVLIVFDFDPVRKPDVNYAAAELARVLTECGAKVGISRPPPGPPGEDGRPAKQAIDDYIARHGGAEFRWWVETHWAKPSARTLPMWRSEMHANRIDSRNEGVYLDTSPTGTGKSHADALALKSLEQADGSPAPDFRAESKGVRSLTLLPTHANCREVVTEYTRLGVESIAFPQLNTTTCQKYDEAVAVLGRGLSFGDVLCPSCEYRDGCAYRENLAAAFSARHAVATQARGSHSMANLATGRSYITLHENPLGMIKPTFVTQRGLLVVEIVARQAEADARDPNDRLFYRYLGRIAKDLDGWHNGADRTVEVPLPECARHVPENMQRDLNNAIIKLGVAPLREAMQIALGAALGVLSLIAVAVDEHPGKGGEVEVVRSLSAVSRTELPTNSVVWINDATASRAELEAALGCPVRELTPPGRLPTHHPVLQVIPRRDVTMAREPGPVSDELRGLLRDLPHCRVGLLTHQKLAKSLPGLLADHYRDRLTMVEYFGSGLSRGSNLWVTRCDALIVLGTPRVAPDVVRAHLLRFGNLSAAKLDRESAGWGPDWWSGVSESGRRVTVRTPHYRDHAWHAAYCSLVRAELVQAAGRGRGLLPGGIPVYLVTTENLAPPDRDDGANGYPIADHPFAPLTEAQTRVLETLYDRRGIRVRRKSSDIAQTLDLSRQRVHELLVDLERAGRVHRIGKCAGWVANRKPLPIR